MDYKIKSVLSDGIAIGKTKFLNVNNIYLNEEDEELSFKNALTKSLAQIDKMMQENQDLSDYLIALKLMIKDRTLNDSVIDL